MSEVAPIEVFPSDYFNLSNSGVLRNAQNRLWLEGFGVENSIRIPGIAQNEDVFEGFGVF